MTNVVETGDGRRLSVEVTGDLDGSPVFLLHGTPGSRLGPRPRSLLLHRLGVRLISFDRPGYGSSDRLPGRRVVDSRGLRFRSVSHNGTGSLARLAHGGDNQAVGLRPGSQGRILFDFRIGITGHRHLNEPELLLPLFGRHCGCSGICSQGTRALTSSWWRCLRWPRGPTGWWRASCWPSRTRAWR